MSILAAQVRINHNLTKVFKLKNELKQVGGHVKSTLLQKSNKIVGYEDYSNIKSPSAIIYFDTQQTWNFCESGKIIKWIQLINRVFSGP